MKILVTGASSYVGAGIYSYLKEQFEVAGTYYSRQLFPELQRLDIKNQGDVRKVVHVVKPDVIVHAAANASASWCEEHPDEAVAINEQGTKNIVESANLVKARVIFISSLAVTSKNIYGKSKANGEEDVKKVKAGYVIVRPSLIMGLSPNTANDRPFNRILKNITARTPARYDTSWKFQPTWLRHLNEVISAVIIRKIKNETITVACPELTTRYDVAKDILSKFEISVKAENKHDRALVLADTLKKLQELQLPHYTYAEMVQGLQQEITQYLYKFKG